MTEDVQRPRVGCGAAILDDQGRLLLVKRVKNAEADHWGVPGGKLDWGEAARTCAERSTISLTRLHATIQNAPGVLGLVCTIIGEAGGNIVNLRMHHRQSDFFDTDIDVEVRDAKHLTNIQAALRACPSVETVDRTRG